MPEPETPVHEFDPMDDDLGKWSLIERHVTICTEALPVLLRFWLTSTSALPDTALAAAQTKGRERYEGFVEALGRRLARGRKLSDEVVRDVAERGPQGGDDDQHN